MSRTHVAAAPAVRASVAAALPSLLLGAGLLTIVACGESAEHRRADSTRAARAAEQELLATQLAAQKDSLVAVVLDADRFLGSIDSSISRVKGLPKRERDKRQAEGVLQQQLAARKDMLFKVDALVKRAQETAGQLAAAKRREAGLRADNTALRDSLGKDAQIIAQLGATIERQVAQIGELQGSVRQLTEEKAKLGEDLRVSLAENARVYYVVGREDELLKKGIIVREGGMNLLVMHPGRSVHAARQLDPSMFREIDAREVSRIPMPDPTKRYRIISRHSLDAAEVGDRKNSTFKGEIKITDPKQFWATSRFLIVVQG
jgi:hypothetical protein